MEVDYSITILITILITIMKYAISILSLFALCSLSAQDANVIDAYNTVTQLNDTTWQVRAYQVNQYSIVYQDEEYTYLDTVLIPDATSLYDSAGIVRYLTISTTNEQARQANVTARAFQTYTTHRDIADANTLITQITGDASNYHEEASKLWADQITGVYRVFVDSSGTQIDFFASLDLVTTPAHPDGRIMRLSRCTDQSCETTTGQWWTVQPYHRWKWNVVNFFGGNRFYVWDRQNEDRPLYRPDLFITRSSLDRIVKLR